MEDYLVERKNKNKKWVNLKYIYANLKYIYAKLKKLDI